MLLATPTDVVSLLSIVDNDGSRGNAKLALELVAPVIASKLGTVFEAGSYVDFFDYIVPKYRRVFSPVSVRLSVGFIDPDTVRVYNTKEYSTPLVSINDGSVVPQSVYIPNPLKGYLTLNNDVISGYSALAVGYDAGFAVDDEGVAEGVPEWLRTVAVASAAKLMQINPNSLSKNKISAFVEVQKMLYGDISSALNPHIRPSMSMLWPTSSLVELAG